MDAAWSAGEEPVVGVVDGSAADTDAIEIDTRLESAAADVTIVSDGLETVLAAEPSVLVAAGEAPLTALARADVDAPVLPVGSVSGIESVDLNRLPDALEATLDGDAVRRPRPVLSVALESNDGVVRDRALFDVTLVTDEPARISEYGVHSRGQPIATFRADGVVAATPAGSHGYASTVDAPQVSAAIDAIAVAPIGPFVTQTRQWVLPDDDLAFTVERNENDVCLVADDRLVGMVSMDARVTVSVTDTLPTLVVPEA
ncbi:NAD(+)/NADH kinase [Haloterrigena sp. H1]|uniref:NAD(+)/NADH kinase n=1 Tax=Haloterrigena sp. H1 TaxID=2552943 RepID=UPI00110DFF07|nr:NAD(+)/NADH kinase [Haloterrigena sp. H1]TMT85796.1 NAD(+)/NADH kinase [Haloterrigena sp. H1]